MTAEKPRELRVTDAEAGQRLDRFLAARLDISREAARRLLADDRVRLDTRAVGQGQKGEPVASGDVVTVVGFVPPHELRAEPQPELPLIILAEGPGWLAIDKPPGLAVHPLRQGETGTVLNAVAARYPEIQGVGEGGLRSGVVHRLDVDTSGALLLATDQAMWERLRAHFATHTIRKTYRAIVLGDLRDPGSIELHLRVAQSAKPARVEVASPTAHTRACGLSWQPLAPLRGATLIEAHPVTGFLHQVRVTFAHLGHPLAGDRLYGPPADEDPTGATRHMLHAARLAWEDSVVECADAGDFAGVVGRLG